MKFSQHFTGGAFGAVLAAGLGFLLLTLNIPLARWLTNGSYDLPFLLKKIEKPEQVAMVYLDDASHTALGQSYTAPWDRMVHVRLLQRLNADGAKAVIFDIIFSNAGPNPETDAALARAIKEQGNVVLGADWVSAGAGTDNIGGKSLVRPYEPFREAARAYGIVQLDESEDLVVREHFHGISDSEEVSLSWAAADIAGASVTKTGKRNMERWMNYYGPPSNIPSYSLYRVLDTDGLPAGTFSNKVVFVGAYILTYNSGERKDEFRSPFTSWNSGYQKFMPGVEVHASMFLNLMRGDWLTRLSPAVDMAITLAGGILFGFFLTQLRPAFAIIVGLLAMFLISWIAHLLAWRVHVWFPWLVLVAVEIPVALLWSISFNSVQLYVQNKLYEQSLSRYLSPKLVKKLARAKDRTLSEPGAAKQMLTVIFSDIANFTAISEYLDSDELAKWMNNYFERSVNECIHRTDGTVVKYIGDAIFAFWNAPENQSDHAHRACVAALHFRDQGVQYINGQPVYTRIGLHTGEANVGNFGSTTRIDYTAFGANINLASRMEGLNKYLGTQVLITGDTQKEIGESLVFRSLGKFRLKGFEKSVDVYELLDEPDKAARTQPLRDAFAAALKLFHQREWEAAEAAFKHVLEISADDGPSKFYLKHLKELHDHPPSATWTGEVELKEK